MFAFYVHYVIIAALISGSNLTLYPVRQAFLIGEHDITKLTTNWYFFNGFHKDIVRLFTISKIYVTCDRVPNVSLHKNGFRILIGSTCTLYKIKNI